ncbi:peptide chain release factor 3 [Kineosporia sp. J2-2]|uniref:Peptide chain release factor 3 n=1 Tax=Kineosporia corallincola TaxID=2835133 RepID=A0ABS5TSA4_9ACTN|nr:peptide chain release factor 3 [Kineosporia corallincola]MBT0773665.1 peptide chain release factor 3 [Kineosporia corallincola]
MSSDTHAPEQASDITPAQILAEAGRRRTIAVISHPDAGKSTLTEALALHAKALREAGHVHGRAGRAGVVTDWQDMEKQRGISISSAVVQLSHRDQVINVVDTPGHADFSEDTYRALTAVDAVIMLVDAARGMEVQTRKLFGVCKQRGLPVITVVNKWDRPGREALELLDEVESVTGLKPTPMTWPVGIAGDFRGLLERGTGSYVKYTKAPGGATLALEQRMDGDEAVKVEGTAWQQALDEHDLLSATGADHDEEEFLAFRTTPVYFTAAVANTGVGQVLDSLVDVAPSPHPQADVEGQDQVVDGRFSAQVFKTQTGMNPAHRDRLAFARIRSGVFHRGMTVRDNRSGRPMVLKHVQTVFGADRSTVDVAYPGDVIGLVNARHINVGDTLSEAGRIAYPPLPVFAPEHFRTVRPTDLRVGKQFRQGLRELDAEGVVRVLTSDSRGHGEPVLSAVGSLQFDVVQYRMTNEYRSPVVFAELPYTTARITDADGAAVLRAKRGVEVLEHADGRLFALFSDEWRVRGIERDNPGLHLEELVATSV